MANEVPNQVPSQAPGQVPSQAPGSSQVPSQAPGQVPSQAPGSSQVSSQAPGPSQVPSQAPGQVSSQAPGPSQVPSQAPNQVNSHPTNEATIQGTQTQGNEKKQKALKKSGLAGNHGRSEVWDYFNKVLKEDKKYTGIAICIFCDTRITAPSSSGTNKLWTHTRVCKSFPRDENDKAQTLMSIMGGQASNWKFDQELCRKFLAKMIILCELPFCFVEKEGFKMFCGVMQPKFHVVSRTTVTKDCLQIYHEEKSKLIRHLNEISSRICLTTDMWTSVQNLGYMVVTAHFVDRDWVLRKKIISLRVIPHPHKGEVIAKALETCLLEWGIGKVMTLTLDNAKNNDTCITELKKRWNKRNMILLSGEFFHVRCFAHVINLAVQDGIEEIKDVIKRLRRSVKYVRSSPSRLQMFKKCASEENIECKKTVCIDVKTRWNSTYLMIDAAMRFEKVFERLLDQDPFYKSALGENGTIDETDWRQLKSLHTFLEDFFHLTLRISGSHYVTSNTYFHEVTQIKDMLALHMGSDDYFLSRMAMKMTEKLDKYCGIEDMNPILVAAVVLDPRYKFEYVEFWYEDYLNSVEGHLKQEDKEKKMNSWVGRFKNFMSRLYLQYKLEASSLDVQSANLENGVANQDGNRSKKEKFRNNLKRKEHADANNDLEKYLSDGIEDEARNFDVLAWWKGKYATYHALALMARDVFSIPLTSVASESAFSAAGRVLDPFRSSLTPNTVEALVCTQDWLRDSKLDLVSVEEQLEELETIEEVVSQELGGMALG